METQQTLGADDYQMLFDMSTSSDAGVRAQASALAKKMTPDEQGQFFTFQKKANTGRDATSQRPDSNIVGWGQNGAGVAPEDLLMVGQAGRAVASAASGSGGSLLAGAKEAIAQAAPAVKYEATKTLLQSLGVPAPMATAAAIAVSGYKRGAPKEVPAEAPADLGRIVRKVDRPNGPLTVARPPGATYANPTGATPSVPAGPVEPVASNPVVPGPQAEPVARTAASPPSAESPPSGPRNSLPDQKALNEEAIARRRAEYQARVESEAAAKAAEPPAKFVPTPDEMKEYLRLLKDGKTAAEAGRSIVAMRDLKTRFGLTDPTPAETRFPKGMRGKGPPPQ